MLAALVESFTYERRVVKALRDTVYPEVQVPRSQCLRVQTDVSGLS